MFERLSETLDLSPLDGPQDSGAPPVGLRDQIGALAGSTFNNGLYRLHTESSERSADQLVLEGCPGFEGRSACCGMDWLGRQFSVASAQGSNSEPEVLLFDVGAGEALEIPATFSRFHDEELVD